MAPLDCVVVPLRADTPADCMSSRTDTAIVFEALVEQCQQEDGYHGTNKACHRIDVPPGKENGFIVTKMELCKANKGIVK